MHFVRCLKPNPELTPGLPDPSMLLEQLVFSGMLEAVQMMRTMFPGRIQFAEVHKSFQGVLPDKMMKLCPSEFVRVLVSALEVPAGNYQIGRSLLFFRTGGASFLEKLAISVQLKRRPGVSDEQTMLLAELGCEHFLFAVQLVDLHNTVILGRLAFWVLDKKSTDLLRVSVC